MGKAERRLPKGLCARCGVGKIFTGPQAHLNFKSLRTALSVCPDCAVDEMWEAMRKDMT